MNGDWIYPSQKQRIAELYAQGRSIPELAKRFRVATTVIQHIVETQPRQNGSRKRLIAESLCWQAEHGRAV